MENDWGYRRACGRSVKGQSHCDNCSDGNEYPYKCEECEEGFEEGHTEEVSGPNGGDSWRVRESNFTCCGQHLVDDELAKYAVKKADCLEKVIAENRELKEAKSVVLDSALAYADKVKAEIEELKKTNAELAEGFNKQTDHINRLLAKEFNIKGA